MSKSLKLSISQKQKNHTRPLNDHNCAFSSKVCKRTQTARFRTDIKWNSNSTA